MPKTRTKIVKLTDTPLVILGTAAQRADGSLLPLPRRLAVKGAALTKVLATLCKRKLVEERRVIAGAPEWRRDGANRPLGLFITAAGLQALGVDDAQKQEPPLAAENTPSEHNVDPSTRRRKAPKGRPPEAARRAGSPQSKQDLVIGMLRRRSGVPIDEIITETGWQPHSVRGFFSGLVKKKLRLPLVSSVGEDGVRRYHIADAAPSKA